jgi:inorganic pyrophosphatase
MGADLFGSFAESTCAALVVSATLLKTSETLDSKIIFVNSIDNLMYPLVASAFGILACILTAIIGIYVTKVN